MRVGELFAGIGGFGLAAERAGCSVAWASEIDDFASRVYAARFPTVRQLGDVTKIEACEPVDIITAGFPCQDLSVAGKRKGLVGERSGLFWEIVRLASRIRPRWLLLENVPGLLSSHRGRDFETVLAALDELGYGLSWRVLDAQFFGVPQRRRRVFIVGHLGGACPAEVLFEPESVSGNLAPRREAGAGVAGDVAVCLNSGGNDGGFRTEPGEHIVPVMAAGAHGANGAGIGRGGDPMFSLDLLLAPTLRGFGHGWQGQQNDTNAVYVAPPVVSNGDAHSGFRTTGAHAIAGTLAPGAHPGGLTGREAEAGHIVTHSLRAEGADASEDGTGRGTPIVPVVFGDPRRHDVRGVHRGDVREKPCLNATNNDDELGVVGVRPRRLTPRECERLQGFPDDWTLIEGASDSARYRALGNAVAVPCVEWILRRLAVADSETLHE